MISRAALARPRMAPRDSAAWHDWADTIATLHMWTQIVGKIRMAQMPALNHWWHVPLYVTSHGLTTGAMPYGDRLFALDFDFVEHRLVAEDSDGRSFRIDLRPISVATFYRAVTDGLASLSIDVSIRTTPVEVEVAIPFEEDDEHASYDADHARAFWQGLTRAHRLMTEFRGGFIGKASPVHFFWGGFDLAVTRFCGRSAPLHPGGIPNCPDWVMHEAYSHEVSSAGWWPSSSELGPAFYSYMYPQPGGFAESRVSPERATFDTDLGLFVLREADLQEMNEPETAVLDFFRSTYQAGADLARWDRPALEATHPSVERAEAPPWPPPRPRQSDRG
jgi:hypothetical protein